MRVVVLYNEPSEDAAVADHDVIAQRDAVSAALQRLGHDAVPLGCTLNLARVQAQVRELGPDCVFNLVESLGGTDRLMPLATLLLDALGVPYSGATTDTVLRVNDKMLAKERLQAADLPTPPWWTAVEDERRETRDERCDGEARDVTFARLFPRDSRLIVKPIYEHASVGMSDAAVVAGVNRSEVERLIRERQAATRRPHFAEAFIDGREFNLSLLSDGAGGAETLPPAEIDFSRFPPGKPKIVGHSAKWDASSFEYHHTPRQFEFDAADGPLLARLRRHARKCWDVFGLRGYARVDFRVDAAGRPWILEINANPCLTPDAGFAAAAAQAGIAYEQVIARILEDVVERTTEKRQGPRDMRAAAARLSLDSRFSTLDPHLRYAPTPADCENVRRIVASTGFFHSAEIDVAVELVEERLAKGPASGYEFVFADDEQGRTVAYACYGPIACTIGSFDLYWIAVDQSAQRTGLGRRVLAEAERLIRAQAGRRIYIETSGRPQYVPTRGFYERCGYHQDAVLRDFYAPGDDKVVFVKVLE